MNILFWAIMVLMLLLAIVLLVYPLLKVKSVSSIAYKDSNLKINDEKIRELDADLAEGRIDREFYNAARDELDRELLIDIPVESKDNASQHYTSAAIRQPTMAMSIALFIPLLAFLVYLNLGMQAASDESFMANLNQIQNRQSQGTASLSMEEMASKLEQRLEENGGTVQDWSMLARAQKHLGRNELAAKAFKVALEQDGNNAPLMLELAEIIALGNGSRFNDEARDLVMKAYELQPDDANVLWFTGVAEYQYGNYHEAISLLQQLLPALKNDDVAKQSIVSVVSQSREKLIEAGETMPELDELLGMKSKVADVSASDVRTVSASIRQIHVAVDISDEVRRKFDASDTVFVYAKAKQGPRMPLAAHRMTLAELPATILLDDTMAMVEGMNLSAFEQLVVSARVTKTGSAIAQSGDYIGQIDVTDNKSNASLNVKIEQLIP